MRPPITSVFLSHSSADKRVVGNIGAQLAANNIKVWIDEAEIRVGDSLIEKISEGIVSCEYLAVALSRISSASEWVRREVNIALSQEIAGKRVRVLPLKLNECEIPPFLLDKKYIDFSDSYSSAIGRLLKDLGVVNIDVKVQFMRNFVFHGLLRERRIKDADGIEWMFTRQFLQALRRIEVLGIGIYGVEATSDERPMDFDVYENGEGRTPHNLDWVYEFVRKHGDEEGAQFSASYDIPENLLEAFSGAYSNSG